MRTGFSYKLITTDAKYYVHNMNSSVLTETLESCLYPIPILWKMKTINFSSLSQIITEVIQAGLEPKSVWLYVHTETDGSDSKWSPWFGVFWLYVHFVLSQVFLTRRETDSNKWFLRVCPLGNVTKMKDCDNNRLYYVKIVLKNSFNKGRSLESSVIFEGEFWFMLIWKSKFCDIVCRVCFFYGILNQAGHLNKSLGVISSKPTPVTDSELWHSQQEYTLIFS